MSSTCSWQGKITVGGKEAQALFVHASICCCSQRITKGYGSGFPLCLSSFDIFMFRFISSCAAHLHLIQLAPVFQPWTAHRSSPRYSACCVATFSHIFLMRELFCLFAWWPPHVDASHLPSTTAVIQPWSAFWISSETNNISFYDNLPTLIWTISPFKPFPCLWAWFRILNGYLRFYSMTGGNQCSNTW